MLEIEVKKYAALNSLAKQNGTVIFGGGEDTAIPLCELKQAFSIEGELYNRSISGLSVDDAAVAFDLCAAPLCPDAVLLHLGKADLKHFKEAPAEFDSKYRGLIAHIRSAVPDCRIAVISLKNPGNDADIAELNRHLKSAAQAEKCEFDDIADESVRDPSENARLFSFVHSLGFVSPLQSRRPLYDLARILFCCAPVTGN